jgi:hypothetical protein
VKLEASVRGTYLHKLADGHGCPASRHEEAWTATKSRKRSLLDLYRVCVSWIGIRRRFEVLDARYGGGIEKCKSVKTVAVQKGLGEIWGRKYDYSTQTNR